MSTTVLSDGMLELTCPKCREPIPSDEINIGLAVARCPNCRSIFSFAGQLPSANDAQRPPRPEIPLPPSIQVEQWGEELSIVWRWFTWKLLFLAFFCVAWDSFLIFWYAMALFGIRGSGPPGAFSLMMVIFPVAHVAVGVGLTYFTVACFFNKTRIRIAGGTLSVRHGPVPWAGGRDLPADSIEQLYCTQKTTRSEDSTSYSYDLNAMLKDGRQVVLVKRFENAEQALYLEQTIEDHLHIADQPVGGELPR